MTSSGIVARRHKTWSRPISALWGGFRRNPRLAWQLARHMKFNVKSLRQFSLAIHGLDFLSDVYAAAVEARIEVFVMWGTLLGAIRHNGLLPGDTDIDFGLLPGAYRRKDAFAAAMVSRGYLFERDENWKFRFLRPDRVLHADFDVFFPHAGRIICIAPDREGNHSGASFPPDSFDRLRALTIAGGVNILIPDPPERVLETIYGTGWRVPDPDYRSDTDLANRVRFAPGESVPGPG